MGAVKPVGQLYGSPTALTSQYLACGRYCTYVVHRPSVAPEPRKGDQFLMQTRSLLLNSHFAVYRNQTREHMKNRSQ